MNHDTKLHEPRPEFRANLEWEIARTHRRLNRLSAGSRFGRRKLLSIATMVLVGVMIGTLASVANAQVQNAQQREQLLIAVRAELDLASRRFQDAQASLVDARQRYDAGAVASGVLEEADANVKRTEALLAVALLKVEEVQTSSRPIRDDLSAPRIEGRDFVGERLKAELRAADATLESAERRSAQAYRRLNLGMNFPLLVNDTRVEVIQARETAQSLASRLRLREEFLQGHLDAVTVEREGQRVHLVAELAAAEAGLTIAEERLGIVRQMRNAGQIGEIDVMRAELEAEERRVEIDALRARLNGLRP